MLSLLMLSIECPSHTIQPSSHKCVLRQNMPDGPPECLDLAELTCIFDVFRTTKVPHLSLERIFCCIFATPITGLEISPPFSQVERKLR